jgi:hypothetical protein
MQAEVAEKQAQETSQILLRGPGRPRRGSIIRVTNFEPALVFKWAGP